MHLLYFHSDPGAVVKYESFQKRLNKCLLQGVKSFGIFCYSLLSAPYFIFAKKGSHEIEMFNMDISNCYAVSSPQRILKQYFTSILQLMSTQSQQVLRFYIEI